MKNPLITQHLDRLKAAIRPNDAQANSDWICRNTRLRQKDYSFKGHAYQKTIADDPARVIWVRKPSQVGISELSIRKVLAFLLRHNQVTAIYTLPTAGFAQTFAKTRVDTVLRESPNVSGQLIPGSDNSMVKIFLNNSMVFFSGASKTGQAISVPADMIIYDELDFAEDPTTLTQYTSRLTHSDFKLEFGLSTPTLPGIGISENYESSQNFVELTRCHRCNHDFQPDYYEDVVLPLFNGSLHEINFFTKELLTNFAPDTAWLKCPKCHKKVDTSDQYRRFVCVNPGANFDAHGYQITPFAAPATVTPGDLIRMSTKYRRTADFYNFGLGLPYSSAENQITTEEIDAAFAHSSVMFPDKPPYSVMGLDMGGQCACLTAGIFGDGHLRVYTADLVNLHELKERYPKIAAEQRVIATVMDAMPYTDVVMALQSKDPNSWACLFGPGRGTELFQVREQEEDQTKATFGIRQISVKRDAGLDLVVDMLRAGKISFSPTLLPMKDLLTQHLQDLKRIKKLDKKGDEVFVWQKSKKGIDHFFFALLYLVLASYLRGVSTGVVELPSLLSTIKIKQGVEV